MGLGIDMRPRAIRALLWNPSGLTEILKIEHSDTGDSPAEIMADMIKIIRADTKKLAENVVEISISD